MYNSITCVLLDDEPSNIEVLTEYLKQSKNIVLTKSFSDSVECLNYLLRNKIDLLITDVFMPKLTGIDLYNQLHELKETEVIFVTGFEEKLIEVLQLNAIDFLYKPVSNIRFIQSLEKAFHIINSKRNIMTGEIFNELDKFGLSKLDLLTYSQMQVLKKIAEGYKNREIADIFNVSIKTIETHRTNIKQQLNITGSNGLNMFALKIKSIIEG